VAVFYNEYPALLTDQFFTLNPKQNPPVIYPGHWMMSGIEPEEEIYIYIYKQRVGGLAVEEKMMKMVVVLVLVGSSATCTTHSKRRTHTIKRTKITARARARGQSCWAEGRGTIKCNVHIQMERLQFQIGEGGALAHTNHIQVRRGWSPA